MAMMDRVQEHVRAVIESQSAQVESDLAEAMALQDFDHLDRLTVVHFDYLGGPPPTVASLLEGPG